MSRRALGSIRSAQVLRGKRERALLRELQAESLALRERFTRFLNSSDLLEDMVREGRRLEPSENGKQTKAEVDVPADSRKPCTFHGSTPQPVQYAQFLTTARFPSSIEAEKQEVDVPADVAAIVARALNRARPLWDEFEANIRASLLSEEVKAFEAGAGGAMRQIGFQGVFDLKNPRILDYLATRTNMLAGDVSDTSFDAIRETIIKGFFVDGRGPLDVARDLRNEFSFLSGPRSRTIARTETLIATEQGQFEQWAVIGVERKRWMSVRDVNTRPWHLAADGQTVALFEPFIVNGEEMMHVGDPTASAENILNCLCGDGPIIDMDDARQPWLGE